MRTIRFKAKRIDNGEWIKGGLWYFDGSPERIDEAKIFLLLPDENRVWNVQGVDVDPKTACQFTGLFDKNGVEIYEGDKIRYYTSMLERANIYTYDDVCFEAAAFMPFWVTQHTDQEGDPILYETIEVTGNIHDK